LRESYIVLPNQIQNLPKFQGILKVAEHPAALVKIKYQKFAAHAPRFVSIQNSITTKV
jgi:hypothetical protein